MASDLKVRLAYVRRIKDENAPEPIREVGPAMLTKFRRDAETPRHARFKRAEALAVAIQWRLLSEQTGEDWSLSIQFQLKAAAHYRRREHHTAPRRMARAA